MEVELTKNIPWNDLVSYLEKEATLEEVVLAWPESEELYDARDAIRNRIASEEKKDE